MVEMADKLTAEPEARLFVGGLGWATTNESFAAYFGTFGKLVEAFVVLHKVTGVPRGFGFVWFQDVAVADSVLRMEHVLDGRKLELKKSLAKDPLKHGTSASSGHLTGHQGPPAAMMEKAGHEGMRDANVSVGALSTQMGMLTLQRDISGTTTLSNEREGDGGASGQGGQAGAQGGGNGPTQDMHGHVSMQHMLFDPTTGQPIPSPYGLPAGYDMGGAGMTGGAHLHHPYGAAAHHHPAYAPPVGYRAVPGAVYAGYAPHAYAVAPHHAQGAYGAYPGAPGPHMAYAASPYGRTPQGYALPPPYGGMPPPGYALAAPPAAYAAGLPAAYTGPVPKAYDSLPPGTLATNIPQAMAAKAAAASVAAKAASGGPGGTGSPLQGGQAPSGSEAGSPSLAGSSRGGPQGAVMMPAAYGAYPDAYAAAFGYPPVAGYPGYGAPHPAAAAATASASAHSARGAQASAAHAQHSAHAHGHGHGPLPTTSPITRTPSGGSGAAGQPRHMQADSRKVFVGGLPATITEADFRSYFSRYGTLVDCVVMVDRETGRSRGFGFITYDSENGADLVLMEKHMLHGKIVDCKRAEPKVEHIVAAGSLGTTMALSAGGVPTPASVGPARAAAVSSGVPAAGPAGSPGAAGASVAPAAGPGAVGAGGVSVGHGGSTAGLYKLSGMADAVTSWRTSSSGTSGAAAGAAHAGDAGQPGGVGAGGGAQSASQAQGAAEQGQEQRQGEGQQQQQQFAFSMGILGINPDEQPYPYHPDGGFDHSAHQ